MKQTKYLSFVLVVASVDAATSAKAQEPSTLNAIVVTATRTDRAVVDTPATITVISNEDLEKNLSTNIKDALKNEPNLSVRRAPARFQLAGSSTGREASAGVNIRGLEGNRVRILVDGVRVPNAYSFGATSIGRGDYFDLGLVKRIEILRGSASALYGSDGLAGVVSFTTRDPSDFLGSSQSPKKYYGAIASTYSHDDASTKLGLTAAARVSENLQLLAILSSSKAEETKNFGTNEALNSDRSAPNPSTNQQNSALIKLAYQSGFYSGKVTIETLSGKTETDVFSSRAKLPLTATSVLKLLANDRITRDRISIENRFNTKGALLADDVLLTVYFQSSKTRQFAVEDRNTALDRERDTTYAEQIGGLFVQANKRFANQLISYGVDLEQNKYSNLVTGVVAPMGEVFPLRRFPNTAYTTAAVFLQSQVELNDFSIIPSIRYDRFTLKPTTDGFFPVAAAAVSGSATTPKLGLLWRATPVVSVYGNVAQGFKAPAPQQLNQFFENVTSFYKTIPNPNLRPEKSTSAEIGARFALSNASAQVTLFRGNFKDFIEDNVQVGGSGKTGDPTIFQSINRGKVAISGFELKGQWKPSSQWTLQTAYGQTKGTDNIAGRPINSVDPAKFVLGATYAQPAWALTLNAVHSAEKKLAEINTSAIQVPLSAFAPPSSTTFDLVAFYRPNKQLTLRAGVFNLSNEKYWNWSEVRGLAAQSTTLDAFTQPKRGVSVSARYEFN